MTAASEAGIYRNPPEPGQLVEVRRRQWVVAEVDASTQGAERQHAVTLSSIGEDALGEELRVIWEIEPGAHVIERAGLPAITGQDDSDTLEAFLDAVRWGAATNADRGFLQAPFRSGVSIQDFQLDPLVRAIDMARVNLLIADDVGLGKTIEAGLVIQEMLLRHRARSVLIVCPASLQEKWRLEMLEKFGLDFRIVDSEYIRELRRERGIHANPWVSLPRLITSMDWAKMGDGLRAFRDILPPHIGYPRKFDMLVVDEAHNVAPSASTQYAIESQRTRFIRMIAPHFQHHLFLTATPHNGYTESFTSLLELLDDQRFARNIMPETFEKQLAQVMIRRLKSEITDKDGRPIYAKRRLEAFAIDYTAKEREIHRKLQAFCASREAAADDGAGATGISFVNQLLRKRLFSSPAAFAVTLAKHEATLESGGNRKERNDLSERILLKAIQRAEEDYADDAEVESAQGEAIEEASRRMRSLSAEERLLFDDLLDWAQQAMHRPDSKANALLAWIDERLKTDGEWNGKRVILFTEYRTTLDWLHQILASHDLGGDRLMTLHGGMDHDDRERVKAAFQAAPDVSPVRILLATDAASEGIDLQNHCNYLIHLEIPYNPNVMEQRNGRIDRHGQRESEVLIWHPVDARGRRSGRWPQGRHLARAAQARLHARRHGQREPGDRSADVRIDRRLAARVGHPHGRGEDRPHAPLRPQRKGHRQARGQAARASARDSRGLSSLAGAHPQDGRDRTGAGRKARAETPEAGWRRGGQGLRAATAGRCLGALPRGPGTPLHRQDPPGDLRSRGRQGP